MNHRAKAGAQSSIGQASAGGVGVPGPWMTQATGCVNGCKRTQPWHNGRNADGQAEGSMSQPNACNATTASSRGQGSMGLTSAGSIDEGARLVQSLSPGHT
eukprot:354633-Chlamydomonas_euryale.AAC.14